MKSSPLTPPQSTHSSFEDLDPKVLSRRSTGDSGKFGLGAITEAEWSSEGLGKVTALPTKEHWKVCQQTLVICFEDEYCKVDEVRNPTTGKTRSFKLVERRCCNTLMVMAC